MIATHVRFPKRKGKLFRRLLSLAADWSVVKYHGSSRIIVDALWSNQQDKQP